MRRMSQAILVAGLAGMLAGTLGGCIVREERPRHRVYVYDAPEPRVEVVPAAPEVDMVWEPGIWVREGPDWRWHRGYWRHR